MLRRFSPVIKEKKSILQFFEDGFRLTEDDRFANFNIEYAPWIRSLCSWYEEEKTAWIFLIQGSQTSKTTFEMGVLRYVSEHETGAVPCLWVQSIESEADLFINERLKPFLEEGSNIKKWKAQTFRVGNAPVKVGYASNRSTLRSKPARFIFGDEISMWKENVDYVKKRTRTFIGKRKGIFATTPPEDEQHHSWLSAISGNFYQYWLPCPHCGKFQPLLFQNLKWAGRVGKDWDYDAVFSSCQYICTHCSGSWDESQKLSILQKGKLICVSPKDYKEIEEKNTDAKTLQLSALYSIFTPWGQLAVDFLKAKRAGRGALRIFITDELAEIPGSCSFYQEEKDEDRINMAQLKPLIDTKRKRGYSPGYDLYTMGIDVQHNGEIYWTYGGWKSGINPSFHVLDYGLSRWRDITGNPNWNGFLEEIMAYTGSLYLCAIDSSYGLDSDDVYKFCNYQGLPFVALKECPLQYMPVLYRLLELDRTGQRVAGGQKLMEVNSHMVKDKILAAFKKGAGKEDSWSFFSDTDDIFLTHLSNERRVEKISRGRLISEWSPRSSSAPQHWFSSLVYAVCCAEEATWLKKRKIVEIQKQESHQEQRPSWIGASAGWLKR